MIVPVPLPYWVLCPLCQGSQRCGPAELLVAQRYFTAAPLPVILGCLLCFGATITNISAGIYSYSRSNVYVQRSRPPCRLSLHYILLTRLRMDYVGSRLLMHLIDH